MANRINGRNKVLVAASTDPQVKRIAENYLDSVRDEGLLKVEYISYNRTTGEIDMEELESKLDDSVAAVAISAVNFFGVIETNAPAIGKLASEVGAEYIVYVDPVSLGLLEAPPKYGATIVCGDLHSLGLHPYAGNGQAGFISTSAHEKYLMNYKDFIYGFCDPEIEGEYVFGNLLIERTHYAQRAKGTEYTGTGANLWMASAAVYMALMGPKGFADIGRTVLYNSNYALRKLSAVNGVKPVFTGHIFQEFAINFYGTDKTVAEINKALLSRGIFGGSDMSQDFPALGQSALYCATEVTSKADIDKLAAALDEIL
jgi:glycine dehydrogenase subunit 1